MASFGGYALTSLSLRIVIYFFLICNAQIQPAAGSAANGSISDCVARPVPATPTA